MAAERATTLLALLMLPAGAVREPVWTFHAGAAIASSPTVSSAGDVFVGTIAGSLLAVNAAGTQTWAFRAAGPILSSPKLSPDESVLVVGSDGES